MGSVGGTMRDITALLHIQDFFFSSESGIGCRTDDFQKLSKLYSYSDLVAEIQKVLTFAKQSEDRRELLLLPGLAFTYLYAYLYFELNLLDDIYNKCLASTLKFEKAISPKWWDRILGQSIPPENIVKGQEDFKKHVRVLPDARPILEFLFSRCENYDHYPHAIRDGLHQIDDLYSSLRYGVPAIIFELLDYMDAQAEKRRQKLWSK
jgi:hypothetical protein